MKDGYTRIAVVLDRSGSMEKIEEVTVASMNDFFKKQKALPGYAKVRLFQFDNEFDVVFDKDIQDVPEYTKEMFKPRGSTALRDAIGITIDTLGAELKDMPESERPARVVVVIMTDGHENASRRYSQNKIADMISHQRNNYKWEFVFLGANQDAIDVGASMNIPVRSSMTYAATVSGVRNASRSLGNYMNVVRSTPGDQTVNAAFTEEDRNAAVEQ